MASAGVWLPLSQQRKEKAGGTFQARELSFCMGEVCRGS